MKSLKGVVYNMDKLQGVVKEKQKLTAVIKSPGLVIEYEKDYNGLQNKPILIDYDGVEHTIEGTKTLADYGIGSGGGGGDVDEIRKILEEFLYLIPPANALYPIGNDGRPYGNVYVPDNVTSLYRYVFDSNTNVQSIRLPPNLISIGGYAFNGTTGLRSIHIPVSLTSIGEYAFRNSAISNITFDSENGNISIGNYAFADCPNLTDNDVYNILNRLDKFTATYIFSNCTNLKNVKINNLSTCIFSGCTGLVSCTAVGFNGATETGSSCFSGCTSLLNAELPDGITNLGYSLFNGCGSLKRVYLPSTITTQVNSTLTTTGNYFFIGCTSLEVVEVGKDWNLALRLNVSNNLTVDGMVALFENLKDRTDTTSLNIQLGATNLAKLSDEQKAIATSKNWTLS